MPQHNKSPKHQFVAVAELLPHWLDERQQLLSQYTQIAVAADVPLNGNDLGSRQKSLCELLVDYISAGHFEVFHELVEEAEAFADGSNEVAARLMPAIADTTEVLMAYDEKYSDGHSYPQTLERDLSALGETLESRFLLEDQLIAGLHNTHKTAQSTHTA